MRTGTQMAVITTVPGLEVMVLVHNKSLTEYDSPQSTTTQPPKNKTVVKFVESHDDADFAIRISTTSQYDWDYRKHALCARLYIDGNYVGNWIFGREERGVCFDEVTYYDWKKKEWLGRRMQFSAVKIVDEEAKPSIFNRDIKHNMNSKTPSALGTITVEIFRGIASDCPRPAEPIGQLDTLVSGNIEMEEKSLKGRLVTHASTFSTPKQVIAPTSIKFEKLRENKGHPIANFKFLYRSPEGLRAEGILPSSSPARAATHSINLSAAYSRSVFRPHDHNANRVPRPMPATGVKIKREPTSDDEMDCDDQEDLENDKKNTPKQTPRQFFHRGNMPRPNFPSRPRQTTIPAPARDSAFPYTTPRRQNTSNPRTSTSTPRGSSMSSTPTPTSISTSALTSLNDSSSSPRYSGLSSGFSSPFPPPVPASTSSTPASQSSSLPPMFLKMQKWHKKQQNQAFMAALSGNSSPSTVPSRSSSSSSPVVRSSSSPLVRRK